jgi:hypothetical protein
MMMIKLLPNVLMVLCACDVERERERGVCIWEEFWMDAALCLNSIIISSLSAPGEHS